MAHPVTHAPSRRAVDLRHRLAFLPNVHHQIPGLLRAGQCQFDGAKDRAAEVDEAGGRTLADKPDGGNSFDDEILVRNGADHGCLFVKAGAMNLTPAVLSAVWRRTS
jgi:hypothetical protein